MCYGLVKIYLKNRYETGRVIIMTKIDKLMERMIEFDSGDPKRIQHFIKVHSFAHQIGVGERLDAHTQETLEAAAIVHDIGIHPAEAKYGRCDGKLQEQEGPEPAGEILKELDFTETDIERICYLIAHHHTYENVEGMDYRILLEADFLVNLYEDDLPESAVRAALQNIFRTETGIWICKKMYGVDAE